MSGKVAAAMSGGVDSSVIALLLKNKGFEVVGFTLDLLDGQLSDSLKGEIKDLSSQLGIPHHFIDARHEFFSRVIKPFADEYEAGLTPNPCVECNKYIKFGLLMKSAQALGCSHIATGHYVTSEYDSAKERWLLKKACDETKDQSYMLYTLSQDQISHSMFPLGSLNKHEVKEIAALNNFSSANKPESQDICFVPDGDYSGFLENIMGISSPRGMFLDSSGNEIGRHKGIIHYTIGQRRGLGISSFERIFVIDKNPVENTVTVGSNELLFAKRMVVDNVNWVSVGGIDSITKASVKSRYRQSAQPAFLYPVSENKVVVEFDAPQRALTPGQSAVFYDGDVVLGGGKICRE